MNDNSTEYWRSRALAAESRVADLQAIVDSSDARYREYEKQAAVRFDESCKAFEISIINQLKNIPSKSSPLSITRHVERAPPPPPLSIVTNRDDINPQLVLKPKRAPPVPPGKAFGSPSKQQGVRTAKKQAIG